ncbi:MULTISPECIES: ABC-three component system protein [Vibrio]|uniref:ABC-three component system protein n=1 Tax=Vibrio kanaloae TaxID=170673 RepID=A0ABV4L984_9VIBR|nr:ABC-three component system protein [Vibrio kanaloae]OEF15401.1 hypothetical protein A132_16165 [Vibrio kanaloae 5S-149]UIJ43229.1 hypothetical protein LWM38_16500 [Vibrio kanaloae]
MKKIVVVFIHGLKGGDSTWVNDDGISFKELLLTDSMVSDECEIIEYDYFTQLTEFMNGFIAKQAHSFVSKLPVFNRLPRYKKTKKHQKNKSIEDLSKGLESNIRAKYKDAEHVILVGHSMGGLVAKKLIVDQIEGTKTINIIGYVSLAVPHKGSLKSLFLQFSSNEHIQELMPLDKQTLELDEKWEKYKDSLPESTYLIALDDEVVKPHTARPNNISSREIFNIDQQDHTTICKPDSKEELSFIIIRDFIKSLIELKKKEQQQIDVRFQDLSELDQEIFVIKLLVSDVEKTLIDSSKSSFFNAEIICRVNRTEQAELSNLYSRVKLIYSQEFYKYKSESKTSSDLVYDIHKQIIDSDSTALKSGIKNITFIEKIGMLHQLADNLDDKVIWDKDFDLKKVKERLYEFE